jgi:hypothetical protein
MAAYTQEKASLFHTRNDSQRQVTSDVCRYTVRHRCHRFQHTLVVANTGTYKHRQAQFPGALAPCSNQVLLGTARCYTHSFTSPTLLNQAPHTLHR